MVLIHLSNKPPPQHKFHRLRTAMPKDIIRKKLSAWLLRWHPAFQTMHYGKKFSSYTIPKMKMRFFFFLPNSSSECVVASWSWTKLSMFCIRTFLKIADFKGSSFYIRQVQYFHLKLTSCCQHIIHNNDILATIDTWWLNFKYVLFQEKECKCEKLIRNST